MERERIVSSFVSRLTCPVSRLTAWLVVDLRKNALLWCRDFLNQVKVKAKAEREMQVMVSLDLSLNLQSRVRRELWRHD
jgi:hypothetical protein